MPNLSPQLFELLKDWVLLKSGIKGITPGDCKALSASIFAETKCTVSETTLKRVYGFAHSKFKPSLFTVNVLANYCGYEGWTAFCTKQSEDSVKTDQNIAWTTLAANAIKITNFTLQALKNRSGIPYQQTIKRSFINEHFDEFLNGDYNVTVFNAPAGYGKTIGLCHWIDEKLAINSNDIVLFFSSSALMNVFFSGRDLNEWLLALLGYKLDDDISMLLDESKPKDGRFFLIIDGFDKHMFKNDQFEVLIDLLMNIFSFYEAQNWFKLVLTMRSSNLINNSNSSQINQQKWFPGFTTSEQPLLNVPLFNLMEINELCNNINPVIHSAVSINTAKHFSHPLYLQYFYKKNKENFSLNDIKQASIYELVSLFITDKINHGPHATEKVLLLNALVETMDLKNNGYSLNKLKINDLIKQYHGAYQELLNIGFLRELNSSNFQFCKTVQFCNSDFLNFTIASKLYNDNDQKFDKNLIEIVNSLFNCNQYKVSVYKWCVVHAINNGQQNHFDLLTLTALDQKEKFELIIFLGDLIENNYPQLNEGGTMMQCFKQDCSDDFFHYFFGVEFISSDYENVLLNLLKFKLTDDKKVLVYASLAALAINSLDMNKLEGYILLLKKIQLEQLQQLPINPLNCLEMIFQYLKYGIVKKDFLIELTRFYFNPPTPNNDLINHKTSTLLYLLAAWSLLITERPIKMLRFLNVVKQLERLNGKFSDACNFIFDFLAADAYFQLGKVEKGNDIYNSISNLFKNNEDTFTPYIKSLYYGLLVRKATLANEHTKLGGYLKCLNNIADNSHNKFSKILAMNAIISMPDLMITDPLLYKQTHYDKRKMIRECALNDEIFKEAILV